MAKNLSSPIPRRDETIVGFSWFGFQLLLLPSKYSRWNGELLDLINESFAEVEMPEGKSVLLKTDGLVYYPSDKHVKIILNIGIEHLGD